MAELWFYHLERQRIEDALAGLLSKLIERGGRALVVSNDTTRLETLDAHLWTFSDDGFLPHGLDREPRAESQPILLSSDADNVNNSNMLFCLDGALPKDMSAWERVIIIFESGNEAAISQARKLWKTSKSDGIDVSYWRQNDSGRWEKAS